MNKIDLPQADPDKVRKEIEEIIGIDASDCPEISAKNGQGIDNLLEQLVVQVPPPDDTNDSLQALIIDSCLLYTSPSPRDTLLSRMPSSA